MSKRLEIQGQQELHGCAIMSGSKNAALPCIAAALLTSQVITLENMPNITDVSLMCEIIKRMGVSVIGDKTRRKIKADNPISIIPPELSGLIRGSTILLGAVLARCGQVSIQGFGGCAIGERPIDIHLEALKSLGANIHQNGDALIVSAENLRGQEINLRYPSVGATESIIMAATAAKGATLISNIAVEPEIIDLVQLLRKMGCEIEINTERKTATVQGETQFGSAIHRIISDRIEAGTFAMAVIITGGSVTLKNSSFEHCRPAMGVLSSIGANIEQIDHNTLHVEADVDRLRGTRVSTAPFPGFPTDLQPQLTSLLTQAAGRSEIIENIFESRFSHTKELIKMGAQIEVTGKAIRIHGPTLLNGAHVKAEDLRAGAALILAGLAAEGQTTIMDFEHIERGYDALPEKLQTLGANLEVIESEERARHS